MITPAALPLVTCTPQANGGTDCVILVVPQASIQWLTVTMRPIDGIQPVYDWPVDVAPNANGAQIASYDAVQGITLNGGKLY